MSSEPKDPQVGAESNEPSPQDTLAAPAESPPETASLPTADSPKPAAMNPAEALPASTAGNVDGETTPAAESASPPADSTENQPPAAAPAPAAEKPRLRRPIKIGSQRDQSGPSRPGAPGGSPPPRKDRRPPRPRPGHGTAAQGGEASAESAPPRRPLPPLPTRMPPIPKPSRREPLSEDLEAEFQQALGEAPVEQLLDAAAMDRPAEELQPDTKVSARVEAVQEDWVFLDLGGRNQGAVPLDSFKAQPSPGDTVEVVVGTLDAESHLYHCALPGSAVSVADWSELSEGALVEAFVTGHNKGGLEVQVKSLKGFIPASQIDLFRVEKFEDYAGQKFLCVVLEVNPDKRRLVLSRRAYLQREREAQREEKFQSLAVGQTHEGTVRSVQDFGAFIDLGGVDGLLHVSELSWARVRHPGDLLQPGQQVQVKIVKINPQTRKIALSMRDLMENPWGHVESKYPKGSRVNGRVSKTTDFGAFVELEPGVEGLVHISELAHHRVFRVTDVVSEGQEVEVQVLGIDPQQHRISLSLKAALPKPEIKSDQESFSEKTADGAASSAARRKSLAHLKGGLDRPSGGEQFGLKW